MPNIAALVFLQKQLGCSKEEDKVQKNSTALDVSYHEIPETSKSVNSILGSVFNVTKNALGCVGLFLAYVLHQNGLVFGGLLMVISAFLSALGFYYIGLCCHITKSSTYREIFELAFCKGSGNVLSFFLSLFGFNVCLMYSLILGLFSTPLLKHMGALSFCNGDNQYENAVAVVMITLLISIPLAFMNKLAHFRYCSLFGVCSIMFTAFVHLSAILSGNRLGIPEMGYTIWPLNAMAVVKSFSVAAGAFNCHFNAANFYHEAGSDISKFKQISTGSFSAVLFVNAFIAYAAYFNFGTFFNEDNPCVLGFMRYSGSNNAFYIAGIIASFLLSINISFGFGICLFPTRLNLNSMISYFQGNAQDMRQISRLRHMVLTSVLVTLLAGIAMLLVFGISDGGIKAVGLTVKINCSIFVTQVAFTFPGIMLWRLKDDKSTAEYVSIIALICFGLTATIAGIVDIIFELM